MLPQRGEIKNSKEGLVVVKQKMSFKNRPVALLLVFLFVSCLGVAIFLLIRLQFKRVPKPGNCLLFEKKYCQLKPEPIYQDGKLIGLAFNLPKGAAVFSPFEATISLTPILSLPADDGLEQYPAVALNHLEEQERGKLLVIAFKSMDIVAREDLRIESGELVGRLSDEEMQALPGYNIFVALGNGHGANLEMPVDNYWESFNE